MRLRERLFPTVPTWAGLLSGHEFKRFGTDVREAAAQFMPGSEVNLDAGFVAAPSTQSSTIGLSNLIQIWHLSPPTSRRHEVDNFFDALAKNAREGAAEMSWSEAESSLRIRVFPLDAELPEGFPSVLGSPANAFYSLVAVDLPDAVRTVTPEEIESWGKPIEELGRIALDNVWKQEPLEIQRAGTDLPITVLSASHMYAASHALLMERYFTGDPDLGALVVIPNRHMWAFHPLTPGSADEAAHLLLPLAIRAYRQGPGSVTPLLLWWKPGKWEQVPFRTDKRGVIVDFHESLR